MSENRKMLIECLVEDLEDAAYPLMHVETDEYKELQDLEDYQTIIKAIDTIYDAVNRLRQSIN